MTSLDKFQMIPVEGFNADGYNYRLKEYQDERDRYMAYEIMRDDFYRERPGLADPDDVLLDDDDESFEHQRPSRVDFGINHDILHALLDKVGSEGTHPTIATALFRAGFVYPGARADFLNGPNLGLMDRDAWYSHLFAVYLREQDEELLTSTEPDALVALQGRNRKPYKGYESIMVDTWVNRDTFNPGNLDLAAVGRVALRYGVTSAIDGHYGSYRAMAESDTKVLLLDNADRVYTDSEWISLSQLGIEPDEFDEEPQSERYRGRNRLAVIEDIETYEEAELIKSYKALFGKLDLDVEHVDIEDGEHYEYELNAEQLRELNEKYPGFADDPITGLTLAREDRPRGSWYGADYYVNNWGDMTIRLSIERESLATTVTLVVFMDDKAPKYNTHLSKYYTQTKRYDSNLRSEAAHFLATQNHDPTAAQAGLNEVGDDEYDSLVEIIDTLTSIIDSAEKHRN